MNWPLKNFGDSLALKFSKDIISIEVTDSSFLVLTGTGYSPKQLTCINSFNSVSNPLK